MTELNSTVNVIKNAQRSTENKKNDINFDILNKSLLTKINTFPEINKQINQIHEKNQPQPPNPKTNTNPKTQAEQPKTNTKNPIINAAKLQDIIHIDPQTPEKQNPKNRKTYKCAICKTQFTQPYSLKRHIKTIHNKDRGEKDKPQNMSPKKLHQCTICQTKFTESFSLDRHKRQLHKKPLLNLPQDNLNHPADGRECYTCKKIFISAKELIKHNRKHHKHQTTFRCTICDIEYKHNGHLTRHIDTMHWKKPKQITRTHSRHCFICQITFVDKFDLRDHTTKHHKNQQTYKCGVCNMTYSRNHHLRRHAQKTHTLIEEPHALPKHDNDNEQENSDIEILDQQPIPINLPPLDPTNTTYVCHVCNIMLHHPTTEALIEHMSNHTPHQSPTHQNTYDEPLTPKSDTPNPTPPETPNYTGIDQTNPNMHLCTLCPQTTNQTGAQNKPHYANQKALNIHKMANHPNNFASKSLHSIINQYSTISPNDETTYDPPEHTAPPLIHKNSKPTQNTTPDSTKCKICNFTTCTPLKLTKHVQNKHNDFLILYNPIAAMHLQSHLYGCGLCNKTFYYMKGLLNHIKAHKTNRRTNNLWQFKCPANPCTTTTHHIKTLTRHIHTRHNYILKENPIQNNHTKQPIITLFRCTICNTAFDTDNQLLIHIEQQEHSDLANTFFENQSKLETISPYQCNMCCNNTFIDILSLHQHKSKQEITPGDYEHIII